MVRHAGFKNKLTDYKLSEMLRSKLFRIISFCPFLVGSLAFAAIIYDFGYDQTPDLRMNLDKSYTVLLLLEIVFMTIRSVVNRYRCRFKVWAFDVLLFFAILMTLLVLCKVLAISFFTTHYWLTILFLLIFLRELSAVRIEFKRRYINPAQLFMFSFMGIILLGAIILTFPNATTNGISFIDALFTSTSAVCVTGLTVVDTGTFFTHFGQITILFLIQIGGLGIMTFTSYFSYFFTGESSYENQLMIQEMTGADKITEVFGTLKRVILLTFTIEAVGTVLLFISLDHSMISGFTDKVFFAVFHSVSAFCNAGFSTLTNNLFESGFRYNYFIQLTIALLIIVGGLGFPILANFFKYLKYLFTERLFKKDHAHAAWIININTRIVVLTTVALLVLGTVLFYVFELDHSLDEHTNFGKWVTAFFGSVTVRTAGFNTVDYSILTFPAIILCYFLMWVGASPASTGGGIKTSTFAISLLNSISIAKGKNRIEVFGREISDMTVRRAYSQIFLSIVSIGLSIFLVSLFDNDLALNKVIFECISAFGTVGLSMGITTQLSMASKLVIILTMFIGRISLLTLLSAFIKQVKYKNYRYPSEDILIN